MPQPQRAESTGYWLLVAAIVAVAIALRVMLYDPWGQYHADELIQYIEQASRLVDGFGLVPWESRYGIRNGLIPQFLAGPLWLGERIAPTGMLPIHLARAAYAALCLLGLVGAWRLGAIRTQRHALAALLVTALWYDSVFMGVALLAESAAAALLVLAAALLLAGETRGRHLKVAGFLLTLALLVRFQYGPFVAVLVVSTAWSDLGMWRRLAVGAAAAVAVGAVSDLINHQVPFSWIVANLIQNLGKGRAALFGTTGPFEYLEMAWRAHGLSGGLMLILAPLAGRRYWPLLAASLVSVVAHSLIGHKEFRFIWDFIFVVQILAAIASVVLLDRVLDGCKAEALARWIGFGLVCAGWVALAWYSARTGAERLPRRGAVYALAAHEAAGHPEVCGLAVPEKFSNRIGQVYLRRNVPLYWIPVENVGGLSPLPDELAAAANAVLNEEELLSNPEYTVISCKERDGEKLCLLIRPGACDAKAGKPYDLQEQMREEDM